VKLKGVEKWRQRFPPSHLEGMNSFPRPFLRAFTVRFVFDLAVVSDVWQYWKGGRFKGGRGDGELVRPLEMQNEYFKLKKNNFRCSA
jgi:hypothetical protein